MKTQMYIVSCTRPWLNAPGVKVMGPEEYRVEAKDEAQALRKARDLLARDYGSKKAEWATYTVKKA